MAPTPPVPPTDPTTQQVIPPIDNSKNIASNKEYVASADQVTASNVRIGDSSVMAEGILESLSDNVKQVSQRFKDLNLDIEQQNLALVSASIIALGAKDSFRQLSNVDSSGLTTLQSQIDSLLTTTKESPAASAALGTLAKAMGAIIPEGIVGNFGATQKFLASLGKDFAKSADNALFLQNAMLQLSVRSGDLGALLKTTGSDFGNLNAVVGNTALSFSDIAAATGKNPEQIKKYYSQLAVLPQAMKSIIDSNATGGTQMDFFTATVKTATGTMQSYEDIIKDLAGAYNAYNLTGQPALAFSAKMTEVSIKLGMRLEDTKKFLFDVGNSFGMLGNQSQGSARLLEGYAGALMSIGLNGKQASDVVRGMVDGINHMTIAQKSFLSAQSGGAGGLMGAFQIEKMLAKGDIDKVMEKVRAQMTKQFGGKIVTLDEAGKSEQAAGQYNKQRMILQQGPLGSMVGSGPDGEAKANRLLDAMAKQDKGEVKKVLSGEMKTGDQALKESMDRGNILIDKSNTFLSPIATNVDKIRASADTAALNIKESGMTGRRGATYDSNLAKETEDSRKAVVSYRVNAENDLVKDKKSYTATPITSSEIMKNFEKLGSSIGAVGSGLALSFKGLISTLSPKDKENEKIKFIKQFAEEDAKDKKNFKGKELDAQISKRNSERKVVLDAFKPEEKSEPNKMAPVANKKQNLVLQPVDQNGETRQLTPNLSQGNTSTAARLAPAVDASVRPKLASVDKQGNLQAPMNQQHNHSAEMKHNVNVRVEGVCFKCQREIDASTARLTALHSGSNAGKN